MSSEARSVQDYKPILGDGHRVERVMNRRSEVVFSEHAEHRWQQRAKTHFRKEEAFLESVQVDSDDLHRLGFHHPPSQAVFVVEDAVVVTVLYDGWVTDLEYGAAESCTECGHLFSEFLFSECPYCYWRPLRGGIHFPSQRNNQSEEREKASVSIRDISPSKGRW